MEPPSRTQSGDSDSRSRAATPPIVLACILVMLAALVNEWSLRSFTVDGRIDSWQLRLGVWLFDSGLVAGAVAVIHWRRRASLRRVSPKLLASIIASLMVVGFWNALFPFLLPVIPLGLQGFVVEPASVLCQSSKQATLPSDYIALLGDSYAQGWGDWLLETDLRSNRAFHSAHLLHQHLSTDVLSLGQGGAGSVGGVALRPVAMLRQLAADFSCPPPTVMLVYFYEGNDLLDTLMELEHWGLPNTGADFSFGEFTRWIDQVRNDSIFSEKPMNLLGIRFVYEMIRSQLSSPTDQMKPEAREWPVEGSANFALIAGNTVQLPGKLQGPGLQLSETEIDRSVQALRWSLKQIGTEFPSVEVRVVYIPSVLSCYQLRGTVSHEIRSVSPRVFIAQEVAERSGRVFDKIRAVCRELELELIDCRQTLRQAASLGPIHGPKDWSHFNRHGYEVFSRYLAERLRPPASEATARDRSL